MSNQAKIQISPVNVTGESGLFSFVEVVCGGKLVEVEMVPCLPIVDGVATMDAAAVSAVVIDFKVRFPGLPVVVLSPVSVPA